MTGRPIVVHCSAGLGRTGVFVTVHSALECHRAEQKVDVESIARRIRQQRDGMIQTPQQYRFCLEAIAEALAPGEIPRTKSEPTRVPRTKEPRPFSEPPPDEDTPRTKRRKLYLQHAIPPPPPYPPPYSEPSTPPHISSPPPPIATPPPPISQTVTPVKTPLSPEIVVTPPSSPPSLERLDDLQLVERKYAAIKERSPEKVEERSPEKVEGRVVKPPEAVERKATERRAGKTSKDSFGRKPIKREDRATKPVIKKTEPPVAKPSKPPQAGTRQTPHKTKPKPKYDPEPIEVIKEDLSIKFEGFEVPEFQEEPQEEVIGFEIGDNQVLQSKPDKKPEEKKPKPKLTGLPPSQPKAPKPQRKAPLRVVPLVVNRDEQETTKPPITIGKLVIPAAFGGSQSDKDRTPSPESSPVHKQLEEKPPQRQVETTTKWETALQKSRPTSNQKPEHRKSSDNDTPPVLRMIRKMEGQSPPAAQVKPPAKPVEQPAKKPVEPDKPVTTESPPESGSGNVAKLLARFQGVD